MESAVREKVTYFCAPRLFTNFMKTLYRRCNRTSPLRSGGETQVPSLKMSQSSSQEVHREFSQDRDHARVGLRRGRSIPCSRVQGCARRYASINRSNGGGGCGQEIR